MNSFPIKDVSYFTNLCWAVFLVYWIVQATKVKKDTLQRPRPGFLLLAALFVIAVVYISASHASDLPIIPYTKITQVAGVILCAFGVGWAIWARTVLGRNWSSHPNIKEDHQLVQSGPYAITRHPIYTGAIVAFIGTFLAVMPTWVGLGLIILGILWFAFRVPKEEGFMTQTFPNVYPAFKQRVRWALIPYIF